MHVEVLDDILRKAQANASDVLLAVAIQFYADNRIDYDDALRLAGVSKAELNRELVRIGISLQLYPAMPLPHLRAG